MFATIFATFTWSLNPFLCCIYPVLSWDWLWQTVVCTWAYVFLLTLSFHPTFCGYSIQPTLHCCSLNRNSVKEPWLPPAPQHPSSKAMNSQSIVLQLFNASWNLCFVKKPQWVLCCGHRGLSGMSWSCREPLRSSLCGMGSTIPIPKAAPRHKALQHLCRTFLVGFLKAGTFSSQLRTKDLNFHNYP